MAIQVYVYLKNGNVDVYPVDSEWKAREHAEKIMKEGYRMQVGNRMEWFGAHWIDKVCWDTEKGDYLQNKYESRKPDKPAKEPLVLGVTNATQLGSEPETYYFTIPNNMELHDLLIKFTNSDLILRVSTTVHRVVVNNTGDIVGRVDVDKREIFFKIPEGYNVDGTQLIYCIES